MQGRGGLCNKRAVADIEGTTNGSDLTMHSFFIFLIEILSQKYYLLENLEILYFPASRESD